MITKTLQYWGFKDHPFKDAVLEGSSLSLFVNRAREIDDLEDALHNRVTGVYGSLGVGKSTFLSRFATSPPVKDLNVVLVPLPTDSADNIFREILASVLASIHQGKMKVKRSLSLDCEQELMRLEGTIAFSRLVEVGVQFYVKGTAAEQKSTVADKHSEVSARKLLNTIIRNATKPFVIILDDFHNIDLGKAGRDEVYFPLLNRLTLTIDQHFSHPNISFVITLDQEIEKHIEKTHSSESGAFSFAIGDFIALKTLSLEDLLELIKVRLAKYNWKRSINDFITTDALYLLGLCSDGHPRRALRLIRYAMQAVASKGGVKRIEIQHVKSAASKANEGFDETDLAIMKYIASHGPTSASDKDLEKVTGITYTPLRKRLEKLQKRLQLTTKRTQVGKTVQVLYSFPNLKDLES